MPSPYCSVCFFNISRKWHWVLLVRRPATWPCLKTRLPEHWQQHPTMILRAPALRCVLSGSRQCLLDPGADCLVFCVWTSWSVFHSSGPKKVLLFSIWCFPPFSPYLFSALNCFLTLPLLIMWILFSSECSSTHWSLYCIERPCNQQHNLIFLFPTHVNNSFEEGHGIYSQQPCLFMVRHALDEFLSAILK